MPTNDNQKRTTLYPNLREEIVLRQFMSGQVAKAANITKGLLDAALFRGEKLSELELECAARELKRPYKYIKSPQLKKFGKKPSDQRLFKTFRRKVESLIELWDNADKQGVQISYWAEHHYKDVMDFYEAVVNTGTSTEAQYRLADDAITYATKLIRSDMDKANKAKQPPRGIQKSLTAACTKTEA